MRELKKSDMTDKDIKRFWSKAEKIGECLVWKSAKVKSKNLEYVYFHFNGAAVRANRFAYAIAHGECPTNLQIDHICHNTLCVNPDHLQAVTRRENCENLSGAHRDSKTGIRGVSFHTQRKKWVVTVRGKYYGLFSDIHEAEKRAIEVRDLLMTNNLEDRKR